MAWRKEREPAAGGPAAELAALEAEAAAAAAGGDVRAVNLLHQIHSHQDMLRDAGGDREIGELFVIFAREDRHRMDEWWTNLR